MHNLDIGFSQTQGARDYQEDAMYKAVWPNGFALALLSDGMGGAVHGELASNEMIAAFADSFQQSEQSDLNERLKESLEAANNHLNGLIQSDQSLKGMGGTLLAVAYLGEKILWISVGDSPLWRIRDGSIQRLNQNHSRWAELSKLVEAGKMTQAELESHPERSQLTSAVMGFQIDQVDLNHADIQPGDWVILASDGVETISEPELAMLCSRPGWDNAQNLAEHVTNQLDQISRPGQDNGSIVALRVFQ